MTPRDQLHQLVDDLACELDRSQIHANIEALPDGEVDAALERLLTLHRLLTEKKGSEQSQG